MTRYLLCVSLVLVPCALVRAQTAPPQPPAVEQPARRAQAQVLVAQVSRAGYYGLRDPAERVAIEKLRALGEDAAPALRAMLVKGLLERRQGWIQVYRPLYIFQGMGKAPLPALPQIISALEDEHSINVVAAARVLGQIGPEARQAFPALQAAWKRFQEQSGGATRELAAAMKAIDPDAAMKAGVM